MKYIKWIVYIKMQSWKTKAKKHTEQIKLNLLGLVAAYKQQAIEISETPQKKRKDNNNKVVKQFGIWEFTNCEGFD